MNIDQFMFDARSLGAIAPFNNPTTLTAWRAFTRAIYGLPMTADEIAIFQQHTGRGAPRAGGYPEAVAIVGVQSGKTRIASAYVDHAALVGEPGTFALLLGQDHRGAMRTLLRYSREPFETLDAFKGEVVRSTADTLELRNGVSLSAYPCRPAAIRGLRACIVVIDELAFFTATDGRPVDTEMLRAARGRVATTGGQAHHPQLALRADRRALRRVPQALRPRGQRRARLAGSVARHESHAANRLHRAHGPGRSRRLPLRGRRRVSRGCLDPV
jgi:hypothetical protein